MMTDKERMIALIAGKTLVNGFGIQLRLDEGGQLESRYISSTMSDPEWTARPDFMGELGGTHALSVSLRERARYGSVVDEEAEEE